MVVYIAKEILRKIVERLKEYSLHPKIITSLDVAALFEILKISGDVGGMLLNPEIIEGQERMGAVVKEVDNPIVNLGGGRVLLHRRYRQDKEVAQTHRSACRIAPAGFPVFCRVRDSCGKKEIAAARDDIRKTYIRMFPQEKR